MLMPFVIGIVLSVGVALFARSVGFDRDRAFYPTVMIVIALAGHGVFDALHGHLLENSGVPVWWPAFCLAFDLGVSPPLLALKRGLTC